MLTAITGSFAQTDLVRWNDTSVPTPQVANITASQIILGGGVTMSNAGWSGFRINNLHNEIDKNINYNKYLEFSITPDAGYKIALSQFKMVYYSPSGKNGPKKLQVRYSTNSNFPSNGTLLETEQTLTRNSNQNLSLNFPVNYEITQTLYIRIYSYEAPNKNYTDFYLRNTLYNASTQGPTLTGTVSTAAPVTANDNATTAENTAINIDILDNDTYSTLSAITITEQPTNGQNINVNSLTDVTYTPNNNYLGSDSFKYTITDQTGNSNEATVNITVSTPTAPTATADSFTVSPGQTTDIDILSNDTQGTGAFDDITIITNPTNGTITVNPDNTIAYTPNAGFIGTDSFQYKITDNQGLASNTATVTLNTDCACTNTISGGSIVVNAGETYCLTSGTWSGGVAMNGGTICISQGANFNASYTTGTFSGTVINNGTISAFPLSNGGSHTVNFINKGAFTSDYLQNFAGKIENHGTFTVNGGLATLNGSIINNYGDFTSQTISFNSTIVNNYNNAEFKTTSSVNVYSGKWDNRLGGKVFFNGGNVNFTGDLDNSGYWEFERISSLSSILNNYGQMKVYNKASDISSTTYLTNDNILEFIDVSDIQYNGPMLTNNGTITLTHPTSGNFKMNKSINQVYNNGKIEVSGQFEQNANGSKLVNNCTIIAKNYFLGTGDATNNGLIYAFGTGNNDGVKIAGDNSKFYNSKTGFVRGNNFTNSGEVKGYGSFYFTGITNNNGGSFIGDSINEQILFFDTSQTASNIFDTGATATNVLRPSSMTPLDGSSYNCTAPPSTAGSPPTTTEVDLGICLPNSVTFNIDDYVTPAAPVGGDSFVVIKTSLKLFDLNDISNPTNNTTNLVITGKGTFSANTTNGVITFTPDASFTEGMVVEAGYRISNKRSGDAITYPSPKTKITITATNLPKAVNDSTQTDENTTVNIDVLDNDIIGDNPFSITTFTQPLNGNITINNNGTPADDSDDTIDYTPNAGFSGEDTFTYTISDGICSDDTATVTITVTPVDNSYFENTIITQVLHYNTTDRWIEVTNTNTTETIPANKVTLALFKNVTGDLTGVTPSTTFLINQEIAPSASILIKKPTATITNIKGLAIEQSSITDFSDGNDIIIVTKTIDATAWENRFDIVSNIPNNTSLVRIDEVLIPNKNYDSAEWVKFIDDNIDVYQAGSGIDINSTKRHPQAPLISEVLNSSAEVNTLLGLHRFGKTTTNITSSAALWDNGFPDRSRYTVIDENYNHTINKLSARKLAIETNKELTIVDNLLVVTNGIELNGNIRLIGNSQLVQTHTNSSTITGNGQLSVSQESKVDSKYRYNYMSSPVTTLGENTYSLATVLKDGTNPNSPKEITFVAGYDGSYANETLKIADYWIYSYAAGSNGRSNWEHKYKNGTINRGDGYIFKGPGQEQNYTFVGTPNDGTFTTESEINPGDFYLIGNPFPSAINARKFIQDNINTTTGTLYFWQHVGEQVSEGTAGHNFGGYIGGYASQNKDMSTNAYTANPNKPVNITLEAEDTENNGNPINSVTISAISLNETDYLKIYNISNSIDTLKITYASVNDKKLKIKVNDIEKGEITLSNTNNFYTDKTFPLFIEAGSSITLTSTNDQSSVKIDKITLLNKDGRINNTPNVGGIEYEKEYKSPEPYIAIGQGFFVKGGDNKNKIVFNNSQRAYVTKDSGESIFFKNEKKTTAKTTNSSLPILKLSMSYSNSIGNNFNRQIGISFNPANSFNFEKGSDSEMFDLNSTDFYWKFPNDNRNYVIAGVQEISEKLEIPLEIVINENSVITIDIDEVTNINKEIYIKDKLTGKAQKINNNSAAFQLKKGTYTDRFVLAFTTKQDVVLSTDENILATYATIYADNANKNIVISKNTDVEINKVELFDILGKKVSFWEINDQKDTNVLNIKKQLPTGIYIVNMNTSKGNINKKIVIE